MSIGNRALCLMAAAAAVAVAQQSPAPVPVAAASTQVAASGKKSKTNVPVLSPADAARAGYLAKVRQVAGATTTTTGSLWTPDGRFSNLATDNKAQSVNDVITIVVNETTQATGAGSLQSQRAFTFDSGFTGLLGTLPTTSKLQSIMAPNSTSQLNGQAQTASSSLLQSSLTGRVVDVLPNGFLVLEAVRTIEMDNQQQTLIVHGVVRPSDVGPANSVLSTQVADLDVQLLGKGIISDNTRPPNAITRILMKYLGF